MELTPVILKPKHKLDESVSNDASYRSSLNQSYSAVEVQLRNESSRVISKKDYGSIQNTLKVYLRKNYLKTIVEQADECEKLDKPLDCRQNALLIKCVLNFYLMFNKFEEDEGIFEVTPLEINRILGIKKMKEVFIMAIQHFRP